MKPATEVTIRKQLTRDLKSPRWGWVPRSKKLFVTEMDMASTRADLMMVTPGAHTGFEIKSGRDRLDKLSHQVPAYELYCDFCWLVYDVKHERPDLPQHWGYISSLTLDDGSVHLEVMREAQNNPAIEQPRVARICGHLWADELKAALKSMGIRGYSKNRKYKNLRWLCRTPARVRPLVYAFLRARGDWRSERRGKFMA